MLKRKSSKLMSGAGAMAIVASLGSMSTAAENTSKKIGKFIGFYAGGFGTLPLGQYAKKSLQNMALSYYKGPQANLVGAIVGIISAFCISCIGAQLGRKVGEAVGEYIDKKQEKKDNKV